MSRKESLFSFASFLFVPLWERGRLDLSIPVPLHPRVSWGVLQGHPQTKTFLQRANHKHSLPWTPQFWGTSPCPCSDGQRLALCAGMGHQGLPPLQPHLGATHPAIQCLSLVIKEKLRHERCVIHTWHQV